MNNPNFNYSKLKGKITELYDKQYKFAEALGITDTSLTNKLNGTSNFTQPEIYNASKLLGIPINEIGEYFYILKVE